MDGAGCARGMEASLKGFSGLAPFCSGPKDCIWYALKKTEKHFRTADNANQISAPFRETFLLRLDNTDEAVYKSVSLFSAVSFSRNRASPFQ